MKKLVSFILIAFVSAFAMAQETITFQAEITNKNGDIIYIDKGTYAQNSIAINKQITIIGAGTGNTIFDNGNAAQLWAEITSSNVSIKNLTLTKFFNANGSKGQVININGAFTNITILLLGFVISGLILNNAKQLLEMLLNEGSLIFHQLLEPQ